MPWNGSLMKWGFWRGIIGIVEKYKTEWLVKKVGDRGLEIKNEL